MRMISLNEELFGFAVFFAAGSLVGHWAFPRAVDYAGDSHVIMPVKHDVGPGESVRLVWTGSMWLQVEE